MEPTTIVGTGLAILGSKDLLVKVLGPTADYLGGEVKHLVQRCNINLDGIFQNAAKKLGPRMEEPGSVSPRVLKHVVDEGRFCEDNLTAEYYGGILASSKSRIGRDDRGVTLLALVKDLSVYELRFHFLVYMIIHRLFRESDCNLGDRNECSRLAVFIPMTVYFTAMGFVEGEDPDAVLSHCLFGLGKHDLVANFLSGTKEFLQKRYQAIESSGIIVTPTLPGAEMFLWAIGLPGASGRELLRVEIEGGIEGLEIPSGSQTIESLKATPKKD